MDNHDSSISRDGDVTTALVGADWRTERWRAGAVISHSWGSGSYEAEGESSGDRDGDSSSTMTGLFPYGRYGITPRLGIWAVAGYGWGQLSLQPDGAATEYKPGATMAMGAVGLDGLLIDGGAEGFSLTTTDLLMVKTTTGEVDGPPLSDASISPLRLGFEAVRPLPLASGASLLSSLETGIRQDSGDAETGCGADLGDGIAWDDPERGITGEVRGRTLLTQCRQGVPGAGIGPLPHQQHYRLCGHWLPMPNSPRRNPGSSPCRGSGRSRSPLPHPWIIPSNSSSPRSFQGLFVAPFSHRRGGTAR